MEPDKALSVIETSLRLIIKERLPGWESNPAAPDITELERKRTEEASRRDGAVVSGDLLDYTNTYDLTKLIKGNWDSVFQPVFDNKKRTESHCATLEDVRNTIAHNRDLLEFESDLLSGIAGMIRNQVALARSRDNQSSNYYPLIEKVTDGFGNDSSFPHTMFRAADIMRIDVGQELTFEASANPASGENACWKVMAARYPGEVSHNSQADFVQAVGNDVTLRMTITEEHVGESLEVQVILTTESAYHRYPRVGTGEGYDDCRIFKYAVNPPRRQLSNPT